jgi:hypothetical protein
MPPAGAGRLRSISWPECLQIDFDFGLSRQIVSAKVCAQKVALPPRPRGYTFLDKAFLVIWFMRTMVNERSGSNDVTTLQGEGLHAGVKIQGENNFPARRCQ